MNALIEIFRMTEIPANVRADVIIKTGNLINYQYAANVTEPLVKELVTLLQPDHPILKDNEWLSRTK